MDLTGDMFRQLYMCKEIINNQVSTYKLLSKYEKLPIYAKKPGFNKLLVFDLDETLVHVDRSLFDHVDCF